MESNVKRARPATMPPESRLPAAPHLGSCVSAAELAAGALRTVEREPRLLVHAIERGSFPAHVPGRRDAYASWQSFHAGLEAMLAGLPKAPSAYNPISNPKRARARQLYIIERMEANGFITPGVIPEPGTVTLLVLGFAGLFIRRRIDR